MSDLALLGGDIDPDVHLVEGVDAIGQQCAIDLQFFMGEWFLDTRVGVPYHRDVLGQKKDAAFVRSLVRRVLLRVPGVASVTRIDVSFDRAARAVSAKPFAVADTGEALEFSAFVLP